MLSAKKMAKRIKRRAMSIAAKKHLKPPPCPASPKSTAIEEESMEVSKQKKRKKSDSFKLLEHTCQGWGGKHGPDPSNYSGNT